MPLLCCLSSLERAALSPVAFVRFSLLPSPLSVVPMCPRVVVPQPSISVSVDSRRTYLSALTAALSHAGSSLLALLSAPRYGFMAIYAFDDTTSTSSSSTRTSRLQHNATAIAPRRNSDTRRAMGMGLLPNTNTMILCVAGVWSAGGAGYLRATALATSHGPPVYPPKPP